VYPPVFFSPETENIEFCASIRCLLPSGPPPLRALFSYCQTASMSKETKPNNSALSNVSLILFSSLPQTLGSCCALRKLLYRAYLWFLRLPSCYLNLYRMARYPSLVDTTFQTRRSFHGLDFLHNTSRYLFSPPLTFTYSSVREDAVSFTCR